MRESLHHRGPDSGGDFLGEGIGLCMRRLAVIDPETGAQPILSEDGRVVLVLNGEIYNHHDLRAELRRGGHVFAGASDAEVVVHLWEEAGPACVLRLRGMFALALWDCRTRTLFLARDRLGKKPLHYSHSGGSLSFASEPRALFQDPSVPRRADDGAIDAFLVGGYVPGGLSAFSGVSKLPPASTLLFTPGESAPRVHRYWEPAFEPKLDLSLPAAAELVQDGLLDATRVRLGSDVPLGAFLSGGLDSSAVVAAMARVGSGPLRTFSIGFPQSAFDESAHARAVARHVGAEHHEIPAEVPGMGSLERMAWHFGEPFADPAAVPAFQLAEATRRDVTVALSGDGGDEAFGGYRRYWQIAATRPAGLVPAAARRLLAGRGAGRVARLTDRLAMTPGRRYADLHRFFTDSSRERLYGSTLRPLLVPGEHIAHVERAWEQAGSLAWPDRAMATDLETYLPDDLLAKADITSMAHGLEVRSPLLDQELVELAARLPSRLKVRGRNGKIVLKEAVSAWLPPEILDRPKQGFAVPIDAWLRDSLLPEVSEVLLDPAAQARGLFDPGQVERCLREQAGGAGNGLEIWAMLGVELWFKTCVEAPVARLELVA
jgi:asparagine synthase (glutamine-hydrolysing)